MKTMKVYMILVLVVLGGCFSVQAQNWSLTGNTGTNDNTNFLGTKDARALIFKTYNSPKMYIGCNGKVGVATNSPQANLHIHQISLATTCSETTPRGLNPEIGGRLLPNVTNFQITNFTTGIGVNSGFKMTLTDNDLIMHNYSNGTIRLYTTNSKGLIVAPNGNITIGGSSSYNAASPYQLSVDGILFASRIEGKEFAVNHTATGDWGFALKVNVNRDLTKAITVSNSAGTEVFRVYGNGTTYATYLVSKQIKVDLNASSIWYDHVFAPDYPLMPLKEVEQFVKDNRHLPDIPSEEILRETGLNLAEMDGLLLKKVEELTLYIIELEKRIAELEDKKRGE